MSTQEQTSAHVAILAEIVAERGRQDAQWGGPEHDDGHGPGDWIRFIRTHASRAYPSLCYGYRRQLIQVAALAVAAIEAHDRREGHTHESPRVRIGLDGAMEDAADWGVSNFPAVTLAFVARRLAEEAAELAAQPCDRLEYADVLILMAHAAAKQGIDLAAAVSEKMAINRQRVYDRATLRRIRKAPGEQGPDASDVPA